MFPVCFITPSASCQKWRLKNWILRTTSLIPNYEIFQEIMKHLKFSEAHVLRTKIRSHIYWCWDRHYNSVKIAELTVCWLATVNKIRKRCLQNTDVKQILVKSVNNSTVINTLFLFKNILTIKGYEFNWQITQRSYFSIQYDSLYQFSVLPLYISICLKKSHRWLFSDLQVDRTNSIEKSPCWIVTQMVKKLPSYYGIKFITVLTKARHLTLSWVGLLQSTPSYLISFRRFNILPSTDLRTSLTNRLFPTGFPT
jgi:hypothetical protein